MKVLVAHLCPALCRSMDCTLLGSSVRGILEWVALPFYRASSWPKIEPKFPALQADSFPSEPPCIDLLCSSQPTPKIFFFQMKKWVKWEKWPCNVAEDDIHGFGGLWAVSEPVLLVEDVLLLLYALFHGTSQINKVLER